MAESAVCDNEHEDTAANDSPILQEIEQNSARVLDFSSQYGSPPSFHCSPPVLNLGVLDSRTHLGILPFWRFGFIQIMDFSFSSKIYNFFETRITDCAGSDGLYSYTMENLTGSNSIYPRYGDCSCAASFVYSSIFPSQIALISLLTFHFRFYFLSLDNH